MCWVCRRFSHFPLFYRGLYQLIGGKNLGKPLNNFVIAAGDRIIRCTNNEMHVRRHNGGVAIAQPIKSVDNAKLRCTVEQEGAAGCQKVVGDCIDDTRLKILDR